MSQHWDHSCAPAGVFRAVVVANGVRKLSRDAQGPSFTEDDYDNITVCVWGGGGGGCEWRGKCSQDEHSVLRGDPRGCRRALPHP
jgi:hypothetical protein